MSSLTQQCGVLGPIVVLLVATIGILGRLVWKLFLKYEVLLEKVLVQQVQLDKTLDTLTDGLAAQDLVSRALEQIESFRTSGP